MYLCSLHCIVAIQLATYVCMFVVWLWPLAGIWVACRFECHLGVGFSCLDKFTDLISLGFRLYFIIQHEYMVLLLIYWFFVGGLIKHGINHLIQMGT